MEEKKLQSVILESVSYHSRTMFIKTKDGKLFSYNGVPVEIFNDFLNASLHDEFYSKNIVPRFSFQRMA